MPALRIINSQKVEIFRLIKMNNMKKDGPGDNKGDGDNEAKRSKLTSF